MTLLTPHPACEAEAPRDTICFARVRKIDTLRPRALKQPEGCGPSVLQTSAEA
jgi:hypothetical protein